MSLSSCLFLAIPIAFSEHIHLSRRLWDMSSDSPTPKWGQFLISKGSLPTSVSAVSKEPAAEIPTCPRQIGCSPSMLPTTYFSSWLVTFLVDINRFT